MAELIDLLRECIVQVRGTEGQNRFGSGFFVAPGRILTCAHVVVSCGNNIAVRWQHQDISVRVRALIPPSSGPGRYYALPDLATLELLRPINHPCAWLADVPPSRGGAVTGIGFNWLSMPQAAIRQEEVPNLSEVRLEVVGRDGQCWRLTADVLAPGMSGGPVLDMTSGRVVGMLKAKIDEDRREVAGGWIVGADVVATELPTIATANSQLHPAGSRWRDIATRRKELITSIFGKQRVSEYAAQQQLPRPSWWLDPRNHVVPFMPSREFQPLLEDWCLADASAVPVVRLLHAPGGVGKTRTALELAAELDRTGWIAGLVSGERSIVPLIDQLPSVVDQGHKVFAAIDYAETSTDDVRRLLEMLVLIHSERIRILLLARSPGQWWSRLPPGTAAVHLIDPEPLGLTNIGNHDPTAVVAAAYRRFRECIIRGHPADSLIIPDMLAERAAPHRRALDLHAAALVQVLEESGDVRTVGKPLEPLEALLLHERAYWRRAISSQAAVRFGDADRLGDRLLSAPTLYPTKEFGRAEAALSRLLGGDNLPCSAELLVRTLVQLYPGGEGLLWGPLVPDRLGETLIAEVLSGADSPERAGEELARLLDDADVSQAAHAVMVLARVAGLTDSGPQMPANDRAIDTIAHLVEYRTGAFLPATIFVSASVNSPAPLAHLASSAASNADLATLDRASDNLPDFHSDLLGLAAEVERQRVIRRRERHGSGTATADERAGLATSLVSLAVRVSHTRQDPDEALNAANEAVDIFRELAEVNSETWSPDLALALGNLADRLAEMGQRSEALAAAEKAIRVYRDLAAIDPSKWLPRLATSLNNLGTHLANMGRHHEALVATEESAGAYCELAKSSPAAWLPDLTTSLNNLGSLLAEAGRHDEALSITREAVTVCRQQVKENPAVWLPTLAMSLNGLGVRLAIMGHHDEALKAAREAVATYSRLWDVNPTAWSSDLATSLNNLGNRLSAAGLSDQALNVTGRAVGIRRDLARSRPVTWSPELASCLVNLSSRQAAVKQHNDALRSAKEATDIYRRLAADSRVAWSYDLARTLNSLGVRLSAVGRFGEALMVTDEAVRIHFELTDTSSVESGPELASLLNNLANRLADVGRTEDAIAVAEEATRVYRRLHAAHSDAWSPDLAMSLRNLGLRLAQLGLFERAQAAVREADKLSLRIDPND